MPFSPGTHWQGPLLGSDRAGPFADCPIMANCHQAGVYFVDDFQEASATRIGAAGTHWTLVQTAAAGTATGLTNHSVRLDTTAANNAGPTLTLGGTLFTGIDLYQGTQPPNNDRVNTYAIEFIVVPSTLPATTPDAFIGFSQGTAAQVTTAGAPNTAGVTDGAGFLWTTGGVAGAPVLSLWDASTIRTLANQPAIQPWVVGTRRRYGVRIETTRGLRDSVRYFVDGQLVFRAGPGPTGLGQFSATMRCGMTLISNTASSVQVAIDSLVYGTWER